MQQATLFGQLIMAHYGSMCTASGWGLLVDTRLT